MRSSSSRTNNITHELVASELLLMNTFADAARHALKLRSDLEAFALDPAGRRVRTIWGWPATNPNEKARVVVLLGEGRSSKGGDHPEPYLISTRVLHGVDMYMYLVDVLKRISIRRQSGGESSAADFERKVRKPSKPVTSAPELRSTVCARASLDDRLHA